MFFPRYSFCYPLDVPCHESKTHKGILRPALLWIRNEALIAIKFHTYDYCRRQLSSSKPSYSPARAS